MSGAYTRFGFGGVCGKLPGVDGEGTGTSGSTARSAAEIRGRITACFSMAELRRFAEELGVPDIPWERGIQGAAYELVRRFEQRRELGPLVERLRAARPLVEWPDTPTVPSAASSEPAHTDIPRPAPLPNLSPMVAPSPPLEVATLAPPASSPTPRTPNVTGPQPANARPPGAAGPAQLPAGSPRAGAPARRPRRIDSRLALAALGLVAVSLIVAFLIGRASSAPGDDAARGSAASASATQKGAPPPAARPDGVASRAAAAIDRRLESLARACEIPPGSAEDVMRRAFERCGPPPASAGHRTTPAQRSDPPATQAPGALPASPGAGPRAAAATGLAPAGGNAGCVGACERRHQACRATQCGKEPTQSTQYQRYQGCLSDCLEQASKCRLGCL
ncbi:hypothetical protein WME73_32070 [Sorangium sp. So ce302]|uniref:hypothetical protein n=1 Tax=Sorangium sp. So ce302 TaxID=3133297 RepID=UPI003F608687